MALSPLTHLSSITHPSLLITQHPSSLIIHLSSLITLLSFCHIIQKSHMALSFSSTLIHCHRHTHPLSSTLIHSHPLSSTLIHCHIATHPHTVTHTSTLPHTVTLSHSHTVTLSHSHTVTQSHSHIVTRSHSHIVTLSHGHTQTYCLLNQHTQRLWVNG